MIYGRSPAGRFLPRWHFDAFDPRGWPDLRPARRIWLDDRETLFCLADDEDYEWTKQHAWRATESKTKGKFYATRDTTIRGVKIKLFLHKEVLRRAGPPPSDLHFIGDHLDGDSLNDRRSNLRWATPSQNGRNRYGFAARQQNLFDWR